MDTTKQTKDTPAVEIAQLRFAWHDGLDPVLQSFHLILDVLHFQLIAEADHVLLLPISTTLFDLRGSVPVSGVQNFETIRRQVIAARGSRDAINES